MKKLSPNEKCREKDFYHGAIKSFFSFIKKKGGQCKGIESLEQNQMFKPQLEPDVVNLWYFKLRLFDLTEFIVWNI